MKALRGARATLWMPDAQLAERRERRRPLKFQLVLGVVIIVAAITMAVLAPLLAPYDPFTQSLAIRLQPPGSTVNGKFYLLGTDQLGRDLLSRTIYGARISLLVSGGAVLLSGLVGVLLGLVSGYYGGKADLVLMKLADIQLAFPFILLAIAVVSIVGSSLTTVTVVLAFSGWVMYTRTVRGAILSLREKEFIDAAHALGASNLRIIARYLFPNVVSLILVIASVEVAKMVLLESTISFLGLGIQPPTPTWGNILGEGRQYVDDAWWIALFPGVALMATVLGINFFSDGLRDYLDPRQQKGST
jgi:ABC-type dipeptide/oligopeptide/nickel transport system permease subunit